MKIRMLINKHGDIDDISYDGKYGDMFEKVHEILDNPPSTWHKYSDTDPDKYDKIISMEVDELNKAKSKKEYWEQEIEYLHCASAFLYAYHHIVTHKHKHMDKDDDE